MELKFHNHDTCDQAAHGQKWFESKQAAEKYIRNNDTPGFLVDWNSKSVPVYRHWK